MIGSAGVHTSAFLEGHALVVAEDEARVALATLHALVLAARWAACPHAGFRTGTHAQRVGAVGRTVQGFLGGGTNGKQNRGISKKFERFGPSH